MELFFDIGIWAGFGWFLSNIMIEIELLEEELRGNRRQ